VRRREFIAGLAGSLTIAPISFAQELGRTYRIGFLLATGRHEPRVDAFFDELRLHGFIEGRNLSVVAGSFDSRDRFAERAAVLVEAAPDAVVAGPELQLRALQSATRTIPLIGMTEDMVAEGLVPSLARPGGNTTGISLLSPELDDKRQGLLMEAVPGARRMAALFDARVTRESHLKAIQDAAHARGAELKVFGVSGPEEIVAAINAANASGAEAMNFLATSLFSVSSRVVFERVAALRVPAMYQWAEMAEMGGLMAYGARSTEVFRQRARLLIKVLRGAKPADLPVEQPTRFELVINLKTAKAIGHEIPAALVLRADKLVE
jgi:putative ABC transport system substrate-binding protein